VLRVPRTEDDDAYVLVHVRTGTKGVAFELEATEGAHPYLATCMYSAHSNILDHLGVILYQPLPRIPTICLRPA
jgi:hypothetical protein